MLALALVSFTCSGDPVVGLRAGETAVVLDPGHALDLDAFVRSRVLNANTGEPVEDVLVEAWTENGEEPQSIEQCLDRAKTNAGGQVEFDGIRPSVRASKIRLSKVGFASSTVALSDVFDQEVRLSPQQPLVGRVLDLDGKPVVGAIVRTRDTCAHAVPASQTRTDSFGRFRLTDCPNGDDGGPEIEVLGELIAPLYQREALDLRKQAALLGRLDFYVARRAPIDLRLVDAAGLPMAHRRVVQREAPMFEAWTDEDGCCRMFPPQEDREVMLYVEDHGPELTLMSVFVPGVVTTVTPVRFETANPVEARVRIVYSGLDPDALPPSAVFVTDAGQLQWIQDEDTKLEACKGRLLVGGRFAAYAQQDLPVELRPGLQEIPVKVVRNPFVRVTIPDGSFSQMAIQAGGDSASPGNPMRDENVGGSFVPPGVPVTVMTESSDGEIRLAKLPPLTSDAAVDLTAPETIVRAGITSSAEKMYPLRFEVTDRLGRAIPGLRGRVWADQTNIDDDPAKGTTLDWSLPYGSSYRAAFAAPGYTTSYQQGIAKGPGDVLAIHVTMQRRAHVTLRGPITNVIVPGLIAEVNDGAYEIDAAAGPLTMRVLRADQPPIAIEVMLAEGETRTLEVR